MINDVRFSETAEQLQYSAIRASNRDDQNMISFSLGNPEQQFFPLKALQEAYEHVMQADQGQALQYSGTEGFEELRQYIVNERMTTAGVSTTKEEITLISGAQQGINLSAKLFVNKDDIIFCENPTFPGALNTFRQYHAKCIGIPTDKDGMIVDELERKLIQFPNAKMIYTIPDFHNPTGTVMSRERRKQLAKLGATYRIPIVEDSPYGDIVYDGERLPSVKSLDRDGWVVYLGSFSKILVPGLRTGWICATPDILSKFIMAKQNSDLQVSTLSQKLIIELTKRYSLKGHIHSLIKKYKERKEKMETSIKTYFPKDLDYTTPQGGFFFWIQLHADICTNTLLDEAIEHYHVTYVPGAPFYTEESPRNFLRLSFSSVQTDQIEEGMERLGRLLKKHFI